MRRPIYRRPRKQEAFLRAAEQISSQSKFAVPKWKQQMGGQVGSVVFTWKDEERDNEWSVIYDWSQWEPVDGSYPPDWTDIPVPTQMELFRYRVRELSDFKNIHFNVEDFDSLKEAVAAWENYRKDYWTNQVFDPGTAVTAILPVKVHMPK